MARCENSDAQHSLTCSMRPSSVTLRNVSCCPAKDASGRSSAVAEERTATNASPSPIER
jgi:hypothetical protein